MDSNFRRGSLTAPAEQPADPAGEMRHQGAFSEAGINAVENSVDPAGKQARKDTA